ncbi:MAG: proliferating cell nuclear antigen (pcna) [Candidatus Aenigmarchaeota archaeon]|nr:proliferating cell nuclear antigen (pcna) [Candidatus Aenigmarchaeota archaeon]
MFRIVLSEADLLKNSIPIIADIIDEGVFTIDQNGISLVTPDRTMVSVVDLKILSAAFDEYKIDAPATIGLNLANLAAVLRRVKSTDKIILDSGKGDKLKITVEGSGTRTFEIPLIDIKTEKPPVEQLNFGGKVELETSVVEEGIADAEVIGDSVIFEAGPTGFKMYAKGDVSSAELELKKGTDRLLDLKAEKPIKSQYPLDYLKKMIKAGKLSKQMLLEFGTDYPIRMTFKAIDKLNLSIILAPRVSED